MFYNIQDINSFNNVLYLKDEMLNYLNKYRKCIIIMYQYEFIIEFKLLKIVCLIRVRKENTMLFMIVN